MYKLNLSFLLLFLIIIFKSYSQTVMPNGSFESWQNVGSSNEEPTNWNSNKTGGGNSTLGPQTCFRESNNPHLGSYCLKLDNASFFGTPSIAVATTGKIQAPTTNPLNNYDQTLVADPNFNSSFTGRPDSLVGWYRFTKGGSDAPKIHAILHDNFDVTNPDQGGSASHIIGEAIFNGASISISSWTRFSVPFTYSNTNSPNYILITAMAASTQGASNANTTFWIDDLELKYCAPTTGTAVISSCKPITWIDGNTYSSNNSSATYTLINAAGCDSIVTLDLTILPTVDVTTTTNVNIITANATNATYKWINCLSNTFISGETNQSFTATTNGDYAVVVNDGMCSDTSDCVSILNTNIKEKSLNTSSFITVIPNPNKGSFEFKSNIEGEFIIVNELGQTLQTITPRLINNYSVKIDNLHAGIYFILGLDNHLRQKIIVTK